MPAEKKNFIIKHNNNIYRYTIKNGLYSYSHTEFTKGINSIIKNQTTQLFKIFLIGKNLIIKKQNGYFSYQLNKNYKLEHYILNAILKKISKNKLLIVTNNINLSYQLIRILKKYNLFNKYTLKGLRLSVQKVQKIKKKLITT